MHLEESYKGRELFIGAELNIKGCSPVVKHKVDQILCETVYDPYDLGTGWFDNNDEVLLKHCIEEEGAPIIEKPAISIDVNVKVRNEKLITVCVGDELMGFVEYKYVDKVKELLSRISSYHAIALISGGRYAFADMNHELVKNYEPYRASLLIYYIEDRDLCSWPPLNADPIYMMAVFSDDNFSY